MVVNPRRSFRLALSTFPRVHFPNANCYLLAPFPPTTWFSSSSFYFISLHIWSTKFEPVLHPPKNEKPIIKYDVKHKIKKVETTKHIEVSGSVIELQCSQEKKRKLGNEIVKSLKRNLFFLIQLAKKAFYNLLFV